MGNVQKRDWKRVNTAFLRAMSKKGTGNDKRGKDVGNRTLCPHRNFSQEIRLKIGQPSYPILLVVLCPTVKFFGE